MYSRQLLISILYNITNLLFTLQITCYKVNVNVFLIDLEKTSFYIYI